jgi:dinuclear metal center YbgI/SA1388 family protein
VPSDQIPANLARILSLLQARYDPGTAEPWDRVGLVCGDPADPVSRVLFAVDPDDSVVDQAIGIGAQLIVTHHPLLLRGVHTVATDTAKGRVLHRLIRAGIALFVIHTNADHARPGVTDAIAQALGVFGTEPLLPSPSGLDLRDKLVTFVPNAAVEGVIDALAVAGAGAVGDYERAAFLAPGSGTFRPRPGAVPHVGSVGRVEHVDEVMVQMIAPRRLRAGIIAALRSAHPYEEPAFDLFELAAEPSDMGAGRVGNLAAPATLGAFAERVAQVLPVTVAGVRVSGDANQVVNRVAICGGSGDALLDAAAASGADVYLTSDLRHHRAGEHRAAGGCALIDVAHWAAEWMWLPQAAALLEQDAAADGIPLAITVSTITTDPWTFRVGGPTDAC